MSQREQRAFPRAVEYDPARLLTHCALMFVGILIVFVAGIIAIQIWKSGEANTESWAALTGLIGWATSQVSIIFSNRFGSTQQTAKKDEVIAQQTRTAAVIAAVAGTGAGIKPPGNGTTQTGTMDVQADQVNVTEQPPKEKS